MFRTVAWPGFERGDDRAGDARAIASIRYPEPTHETQFGDVKLNALDKKGLLCAISSMYSAEPVETKNSPGAFFRNLRKQIRNRRKPLIVETYTEVPEIWGVKNLPAFDYRADIQPLNDPDNPNRHSVHLWVDYASDQVEVTFVGTKPLTIEYTFDVDMDQTGEIIGDGVWTGASRGYSEARPERVWVPSDTYPWNSRLNEEWVLFLTQGGDMEIVSPDPRRSIIVGKIDSPIAFSLTLKLSINGKPITGIYNKESFEIRIGEKAAEILNLFNAADKIYLEISPPEQDADGKYDLTVSFGDLSVTRSESIRYLLNANVDVPLIIDRSGSMSYHHDYMQPAKDAASMLVNLMKTNDKIGVISFSDDAVLNFPLTVIDSPSVKAEAREAIDEIESEGATAMGAGLALARDQLASSGAENHNWTMVMLSDGYENVPPYVSSILPTISPETRIFTITLGPDSDQELLNIIAVETDGEYFMAPDSEDLNAIYALISGHITGNDILNIVDDTIFTDETKYLDTVVDSSFVETTFTLNWDAADLEFTLVEPGGREINPESVVDDLNISYKSGENFKQYRVWEPVSGTWNLIVTGVQTPVDGAEFTIIVHGKTSLRMNCHADRNRYNKNEPILVAAAIFNDSESIDGMNVWASVNLTQMYHGTGQFDVGNGDLIERTDAAAAAMNQDNFTFRLYDDGKHGDGSRRDGVYANYWLNSRTPGTCSFTIKANGVRPNGEWFQRMDICTALVAEQENNTYYSTPGTVELSGLAGSLVTERLTLGQTVPAELQILHAHITDLCSADYGVIDASAVSFDPVEVHIPRDTADLTVSVAIPESTEPAEYTGNIILSNPVSTLKIPVTVLVGEGEPLHVKIIADRTWGSMPLDVNFNCEVSAPENDNLQYFWDFNYFDGIQTDARGSTAYHVFNSIPFPVEMVEPYQLVTLTATDDRGYSASDRIRINLLQDVTAQLEMPATYFSPGDPLWLRAHVRNYRESMDIACFLVLDIGTGQYWCLPGWIPYPPGLDGGTGNFPLGVDTAYAFKGLTWPDTGETNYDNLTFWGVMIRLDNGEFLGSNLPLWHFGYGPKK